MIKLTEESEELFEERLRQVVNLQLGIFLGPQKLQSFDQLPNVVRQGHRLESSSK